MPSAELFVRLLLPIVSIIFFLSFRFFFFSLKALVRPKHAHMTYTSSNVYVHYTWGLLAQKLIIVIF